MDAKTNTYRAEAPINLDKPRTVKYTLNSLIALQQQLGVADLKALMKTTVTLANLRVFLWAGLIHEDESLTPEYVGNIIQPFHLKLVSLAVRNALTMAFAGESTPTEKKNRAVGGRNGTGRKSSR